MTAVTLTIDHSIPIPGTETRVTADDATTTATQYVIPWDTMAIGDSVLYPRLPGVVIALSGSITRGAKTYVAYPEATGVRVWRRT